MPNTIDVVLKTSGNNIVFHFTQNRYPEQARLYITIENHPSVGEHKITSIEEVVSKNHILKLCEYLLNHISKLKDDSSINSLEFVDDTDLYTVQAYSGNWDAAQNCAFFTLKFLVNIGQSDKKHRVFMGVETVIDSRDIIKFYEHIKK